MIKSATILIPTGREKIMNKYSENLTDLYQMVIESSNNLVLVLDGDTEIRAINKAAREFLCISNERDAIGKKYADIIEMEQCKISSSIILQSFSSGQEVDGLERWVTVRGESQYLIIDTKIIKDISGEIQGIICFFRNMTERKLEDQKLLNIEKQAVLGRLAAGIAHEIRNPLTAAFGFLQLLLKSSIEEHQKKYLRYVLKELKSISKLVSEFMILAKPTEINKREISISMLLNETIEFMQGQAILSNIVINRSITSHEVMLMADAEQLKHVFINLIRNAIEATKKNHSQITISLEVEAKFINISFEDEGIGIAPEDVTKIFDPFFTTKEEGTGLGLTGAYQIIKNHNGIILVESKEGKGTKFIVSFPID
jgi:two-component system, sporulation sensor kinase E